MVNNLNVKKTQKKDKLEANIWNRWHSRLEVTFLNIMKQPFKGFIKLLNIVYRTNKVKGGKKKIFVLLFQRYNSRITFINLFNGRY
jgi:hypothetical protein